MDTFPQECRLWWTLEKICTIQPLCSVGYGRRPDVCLAKDFCVRAYEQAPSDLLNSKHTQQRSIRATLAVPFRTDDLSRRADSACVTPLASQTPYDAEVNETPSMGQPDATVSLRPSHELADELILIAQGWERKSTRERATRYQKVWESSMDVAVGVDQHDGFASHLPGPLDDHVYESTK